MRDYGAVSPQFWVGCTGRKIRSLGAEVQVVALYLMTCPSATMIGLYYLPIPTLAHETGLPLEGASKALRSLTDVGFAEYDEINEIVWVCSMARHQIAERVVPRDNRHTGILREAQKLVYSTLFARWHARYREPFHLPAMAEGRRPSEGAPKAPPSQGQDHGQDHGQDQGESRGAIAPAASVAPLSVVVAHTKVPVPKDRNSQRAKYTKEPDSVPSPDTLARQIYDAITVDKKLCPIVVNPGDAAERWADPAIFPGVDVVAQIKSAADWLSTARKPPRDGREFLRRWLRRAAEEISSAPKTAIGPVRATQPEACRPKVVDIGRKVRS